MMRADMTDLVEQMNDQIADLRAELEEAKDRAREAETGDEYDEAETEARDINADIRTVERERDQVREKIDEWGDSVFRIKELTWGDRQRVDDIVRVKTVDEGIDDTTAMMGAYKLALVNRGVKGTPDGAPHKAGAYPDAIGEWLYVRVSDLNGGAADEDLAAFSLGDEIPRPDGQPSSSTGE